MKLKEWAQLGEVVSSIAVLVTLIFVVLGVRDNTEATRAASYDRNIDSLNEWRLARYQNPDLARVTGIYYVNGTAEGLSEDDIAILLPYVRTQFSIYEKSYFANKNGYLGETEWTRFRTPMCGQYVRATENNLPLGLNALTEEFIIFMETECVSNR